VRWTEAAEARELQSMDIGIMPLDDTTWTRGKCSFKMLQYMATALPVVASPVGMNAEVLSLGECGFAAVSEQQWVDGLITLLESSELRMRMGSAGRRIAEAHFSIPTVVPRLARSLLNGG